MSADDGAIWQAFHEQVVVLVLILPRPILTGK
jgi:hypothetical protein